MIQLDPEQIGKEVTIGTFSVTADDIRKFAEAIGDRVIVGTATLSWRG